MEKYIEYLEKWLQDDNNARIHFETKENMKLLPKALALSICVSWLEKNGYVVKEKK